MNNKTTKTTKTENANFETKAANTNTNTNTNTNEKPRFYVFSVSEGETPTLAATYGSSKAKAAGEEARKLSSKGVTVYVFDATLGLPGHSSSLIFACSKTWELYTDQDLVRHVISTESSTHINWSGLYTEATLSVETPRTWTQEDAIDVDFLHKDGAASLGDGSIERVLARVFKSLDLTRSTAPLHPTSEGEANNVSWDNESEFKEHVAKRLWSIYATILRAFPPEATFHVDELKNPATTFAKEVRTGKWDRLSTEEYNAAYDCISIISSLWKDQPTASLSDVAWGALALEGAGIDITDCFSAIKGPDAFLASYEASLNCTNDLQ